MTNSRQKRLASQVDRYEILGVRTVSIMHLLRSKTHDMSTQGQLNKVVLQDQDQLQVEAINLVFVKQEKILACKVILFTEFLAE